MPYELVKVVLKIIKKTFSFFFGLIDAWVDDTVKSRKTLDEFNSNEQLNGKSLDLSNMSMLK
ncbi:TPA: hypothetical protein SAW74_001626 [Campylobacter jejuni]|nr:hypothetical protein [Campylobacter jejuni]